MHSTKTRIVQVQNEGFDFLGWHFRGDKKWPRKKSLQKLQEKLRPLTRRTRGWSLGAIVAKVNPVLRGYLRETTKAKVSDFSNSPRSFEVLLDEIPEEILAKMGG